MTDDKQHVPIVFLDIDGVIAIHDKIKEMPLGHLHRLIANTKADIVISSTWRRFETRAAIEGRLQIVIEDMTPIFDQPSVYRGNEIDAWQKINKATDRPYVIIDDDSDMLYWQRNHLILVDAAHGLTRNSAYKAERILKGIF